MGSPQISMEADKLILSAFQNENGSNRLTREGQAKSRDCSVLRGRVTSSVTRFRVTSGPGRLGARRTGQVGHQAAAVGDTGTRLHATRFGESGRGAGRPRPAAPSGSKSLRDICWGPKQPLPGDKEGEECGTWTWAQGGWEEPALGQKQRPLRPRRPLRGARPHTAALRASAGDGQAWDGRMPRPSSKRPPARETATRTDGPARDGRRPCGAVDMQCAPRCWSRQPVEAMSTEEGDPTPPCPTAPAPGASLPGGSGPSTQASPG